MQPHFNGTPADLTMLMGRVLERTEATIVRLDRIEIRLTSLEQQPVGMAETIGAIEKMMKSWAAWLVPLTALWATGSIESAVKILSLVK